MIGQAVDRNAPCKSAVRRLQIEFGEDASSSAAAYCKTQRETTDYLLKTIYPEVFSHLGVKDDPFERCDVAEYRTRYRKKGDSLELRFKCMSLDGGEKSIILIYHGYPRTDGTMDAEFCAIFGNIIKPQLAFVGGNTGREVCVQGTTAGSAALKIRMREGERDVPTFSVKVAPVQMIGIHAMIVRNEDETPIEYGEIAKMIKTANDIYAQVCMRFYLASIVVTNLPDAFYITRTNTTGVVWSHDRLTAVMSNVDGVECYFVKGIYDTDGYVDVSVPRRLLERCEFDTNRFCRVARVSYETNSNDRVK